MSWNVCDQKPGETKDDRMMSTGGFLYNRYLIGSKGYLLLIDETELRLNGNLFMRSEQKLSNFALELKEFVDSIRQKREPLTSGRKNRAVIEVLEVAYKSAEEHSSIEIT